MKDKAIQGRENKPHIGIFGRCNSGKSSLLNFIVGADTAIVSPEAGTTTDVVRKSCEILDLGPVIFIDTAGIDDDSTLGARRKKRTLDTIAQIDLALLVFCEWGDAEKELIERFERMSVPYILVKNIFDTACENEIPKTIDRDVILVNVKNETVEDRDKLLGEIRRCLPEQSYSKPSMFEGMVEKGDTVLLVCPIDGSAPAGRLILPQVQAIRELLDRHAVAVTVQPEEITSFLSSGLSPSLVVADSRILKEVTAVLPQGIKVTSFSILLAAAKGDYNLYVQGLEKINTLKDGDKILIAESCTHQVSCEDIGRVKIPGWLEGYTGKKFNFTVISGLSPLPDDIASYALVVQCGGCMATRSQLRNRIRQAAESGVAVTNYGMLIKKIRE